MDASLIKDYLDALLVKSDPDEITKGTDEVISLLRNTLSEEGDMFNEPGENYFFVLKDLERVKSSYSAERKKYYISRLIKSLTQVKTSGINDINLYRWEEYDDIKTDSLWIFSRRDRSGSHSGKYWGNFIPQIPSQLLRRYTKKGDWVLDPFCGSGTTLIEARRLGRNALGIDLAPDAVNDTIEKIKAENSPGNIYTDAVNHNSITFDYRQYLGSRKVENFQFIILHPPYWDIIKFSDDPLDLSNSKNPGDFLKMLGETIDAVFPFLEGGRYLALVIGDKYHKGEWIPLGFFAMNELLKRNLKLKSVIIKNFEETRGKMQQKELWRYRALAGGFYIFKHEYIFLFRKPASLNRLTRESLLHAESQTN